MPTNRNLINEEERVEEQVNEGDGIISRISEAATIFGTGQPNVNDTTWISSVAWNRVWREATISGVDTTPIPAFDGSIRPTSFTLPTIDIEDVNEDRLDVIRDRIQIENRLINLGGSEYEDYIRAIRDDNRVLQHNFLSAYSNNSFSFLDNEHVDLDLSTRREARLLRPPSLRFHSGNDIKEEKLPKKVSLYEDNKIILMSDECIRVPRLGWFKKDDKRTVEDYIYKGSHLIIDKKYSNNYTKVYTDISLNGDLIFKDNYTTTSSYDHVIYDSAIFLPEVDFKNNEHIEFFTENLLKNAIFKYKFIEEISTGIWRPKADLEADLLKTYSTKQIRVHGRKHNSKIGLFEKNILEKHIPNTYTSTFGKKYSFGAELETISGALPEYVDNFLYYSAVHDGSLRDEEIGEPFGLEYVTDVLKGDLGLQQLKKLCYELSKRCLTDKKCSVHFHIGNVIFTKENIILMYNLYYTIQDEIFSMLPKSRRKNEYCKKLDNLGHRIGNIAPEAESRDYYINKYYADIIMFLSKKEASNKYVNKKTDHPKGFKCAYDHSAARYCWVNFIPSVFNTRKNEIYTIEYRSHSASTSYRKIKNWLLICFALVDIVENHKREIYNNPTISLDEIIKVCYPKNSELLIDYIKERKTKFSNTEDKSEAAIKRIENEDFQDNEVDNDFRLKNL